MRARAVAAGMWAIPAWLLTVGAAPILADIVIESRIGEADWSRERHVAAAVGDAVRLRVAGPHDGIVSWYQVVPDLDPLYQNAAFPWEENPYRWIGWAEIHYCRRELETFAGQWEIEPLAPRGWRHRSALSGAGCATGLRRSMRHYRDDVGSFWLQVEVELGGTVERSPGIEDGDRRGLSTTVFRLVVREGDDYLGHLTGFFNVPGVFGAVPDQAIQHAGVDCAEAVMAAYVEWTGRAAEGEYNVARIVSEFPRVAECDIRRGRCAPEIRWGSQVHPGDLLAIRYEGSRQYAHIGAVYRDANQNGLLDDEDLVLHAGPEPLHLSPLDAACFEGHAQVLRLPGP